MIQKLRERINAYRLNVKSAKRKKELAQEIDPAKVTHLKPQVNCTTKWYGSSYGGFFIHPDLVNQNSIVYSIGIGKDISFDLKCIQEHQCSVYGFDPTPKSINWIKSQQLDPRFHFHEYGIATETGTQTFYLPAHPKGISGSMVDNQDVDNTRPIEVQMKSFTDITQELGHTKVDVLKMDIEGAEYDVLANILESGVQIDQILVEYHDRMFSMDEFKSREISEQLKKSGYEVFASSISWEEISYIRKELIN